jgi:hypothetical protein
MSEQSPKDRKALIRDYKETQRPMGVYRVKNLVNGKSLVGTSVDLPSILNRMRMQLRAGTHSNRELQKDLKEHGADAFEVEVLDTLAPSDRPDYDPKDDLRALESLWLAELSPFGDRGYNSPPKKA